MMFGCVLFNSKPGFVVSARPIKTLYQQIRSLAYAIYTV